MFGGSNDLEILRNKDHCVRIEDSSATVQELRRSDFGAPRKAPKTKGYAHKRTKRRPLAEPRAPQVGSSAMGLGHSRAPQTQSSATPWPRPRWGWGPPTGSP